jgi:hypothetical protein
MAPNRPTTRGSPSPPGGTHQSFSALELELQVGQFDCRGDIGHKQPGIIIIVMSPSKSYCRHPLFRSARESKQTDRHHQSPFKVLPQASTFSIVKGFDKTDRTFENRKPPLDQIRSQPLTATPIHRRSLRFRAKSPTSIVMGNGTEQNRHTDVASSSPPPRHSHHSHYLLLEPRVSGMAVLSLRGIGHIQIKLLLVPSSPLTQAPPHHRRSPRLSATTSTSIIKGDGNTKTNQRLPSKVLHGNTTSVYLTPRPATVFNNAIMSEGYRTEPSSAVVSSPSGVKVHFESSQGGTPKEHTSSLRLGLSRDLLPL